MTTDATVALSGDELELIADALCVLFLRAAERRDEVIHFARRHPQFSLFYNGGEPVSEEDL